MKGQQEARQDSRPWESISLCLPKADCKVKGHETDGRALGARLYATKGETGYVLLTPLTRCTAPPSPAASLNPTPPSPCTPLPAHPSPEGAQTPAAGPPLCMLLPSASPHLISIPPFVVSPLYVAVTFPHPLPEGAQAPAAGVPLARTKVFVGNALVCAHVPSILAALISYTGVNSRCTEGVTHVMLVPAAPD